MKCTTPLILAGLIYLLINPMELLSQCRPNKAEHRLDVYRNNTFLSESQDIQKISIIIPHELIDGLIQNICGTSEPDEECPMAEGFEIAGICFNPVWEPPKGNTFKTIGFRATIVLIETDAENCSAARIVMGGFDNNSFDSILSEDGNIRLGSLASASPIQDGKSILLLGEDYIRYPNLSVFIANYNQSPQTSDDSKFREELLQTREFDFAYIPYREYLWLATENRFYTGGVRPDSGIIIERAVSSFQIDTTNNASATATEEFELIKYRTLIARPFPRVRLASTDLTIDGLAYALNPHCPPYWRPNPDCSVAVTLEERVRKDCVDPPEDDPNRPRFTSSAHIGGVMEAGKSMEGFGSLFEVDFEYRYAEILSHQLVLGVYNLPDAYQIYNLNLLTSLYQKIGNRKINGIPIWEYYFSLGGGLGMNRFSNSDGDAQRFQNFNAIVGTGIRWGFQKNAAVHLDFNYQNQDLTKTNKGAKNIFAIKLGWKYTLNSQ